MPHFASWASHREAHEAKCGTPRKHKGLYHISDAESCVIERL
jgi:hypothetical protein